MINIYIYIYIIHVYIIIYIYIYIYLLIVQKIINLCTLFGPPLKWSDNTGS